MLSAQCPHCSKTLRYPSARAGTTINCPGCRGALQLPIPALDPVPTQPAAGPSFDFNGGDAPVRLGPEPWYYDYLARFAKVAAGLWVVGQIIAGLLSLFPFIAYFIGVRERPSAESIVFLILIVSAGIVGFILALLVILFWVALVLLLVDMGRNLRKIRENTQR